MNDTPAVGSLENCKVLKRRPLHLSAGSHDVDKKIFANYSMSFGIKKVLIIIVSNCDNQYCK